MNAIKSYLTIMAIGIAVAGCGKKVGDAPKSVPKGGQAAPNAASGAAPASEKPIDSKQLALLANAREMLQYASGDDAIHIVNVPRKPASFVIKGQSADTYCSLLKQAKKNSDLKSILALLSFYKTTIESETADSELPRYDELRKELTDLLQSQYSIVLDPPKDGDLHIYLLSLITAPRFPIMDMQGNLQGVPELDSRGNEQATSPYISLKAPKEVKIEAFEKEPDGRLTANWNPCCYACWILYGDESFVNNVKKDIDAHLDENLKLLTSKEQMGELKPQEVNRERLLFASNYVANIIKSFESDGEQYLVAATADGCAMCMRGVIGHYMTLDQSPDQFGELANNILDAVLRYEPVSGNSWFTKENVDAFTLRTDAEQETNSLNKFPESWLGMMFTQPSELVCPVGKTVYSVLPPLKYAKWSLLDVLAREGRPKIKAMGGYMPVVYCPYHHILCLKFKSPETAVAQHGDGLPYLGSNTNFLCYCDSIIPSWSGPEENESVQPGIAIDYPSGNRFLPRQSPKSVGDLDKEVIDLLKAQEGVRTQQVVEALKAK